MIELTKAEELFLLTIWRLEDGAYGVAIKKKIKEITGKDYKYGTLYFLLDHLTGKGFINRIEGEPTKERGGRRKIFYKITPKGIEVLKASMNMHEKVWSGAESLFFEKGY